MAGVPALSIRLLGGWEVRVRGTEPVPLRSRSERWLLALLTLRHDRETDRRWLADMLWPESRPESAAFNLRRGLSDLRRVLGEEAPRLLSPSPRTLRLDLSNATCDVLRFDLAVARRDPASLEEAITLYGGPLLEGCPHDWAHSERETRQQAYLAALEQLANCAAEEGDHSSRVRYLRRILAIDPLRESLHCALMESLVAAGDPAAALQVYRDLRTLLHREVNAAPSPTTVALFERIRSQSGIGHAPRRLRNDFPVRPDALAPASTCRLPFLLTSLIGRSVAIQQISACLTTSRLVTLTGTGGVGKTRLGIEVARVVAPSFRDGVCLIELAPVVDPDVVAGVMASALWPVLGLGPQSNQSIFEQLIAGLDGKSVLVLLDNCEHLTTGVSALTDKLLRSCPGLRVVATSREPLGITGEVVWRVPPLELPTLERNGTEGPEGSKEPAEEVPSVLLFLERAGEALPGFSPAADDLHAIARICRTLEGLPLAIELAAARVRVLTVRQIADRLTVGGAEDGSASSFELLADGRRTAPPRHQTLRGTLDWSYQLLTPAERFLFHRLSVFSGGFTLEAVEYLCLALAKGESLLNLLSRLVDQSLVEREPEAGRFRLLETVRHFALDRLRATGEEATVRDLHLAWCVQFAKQASVRTPPAGLANALLPEFDNCRAALRWSWKLVPTPTPPSAGKSSGEKMQAAASEQPTVGLRLATLLYPLWASPLHYSEGRESLRQSLAVAGETADREDLAAALEAAGRLAFPQGDQTETRGRLEEALQIYQTLGDRGGEARVLDRLGEVLSRQGDYPSARKPLNQALGLYRELGDLNGEASVLDGLAFVAREEGDLPVAQALLERALAIARRTEDLSNETACLHNLGYVADARGENEAAFTFFELALAIARRMGDAEQEARCLCSLAIAARKLNTLDRAAAAIKEALQINRRIEFRAGEAWNLRIWGELELTRGRYEDARRLLEESLAAEQEVDCLSGQVWNLVGLARTTRALNDRAASLRYHREALELASSIEMKRPILFALESGATLLEDCGLAVPAVRLLAAASALRKHLEAPRATHDQLAWEEKLASDRSRIGTEAFDTAWSEGSKMSLEAAVSEALGTIGALQE